MIELIIGRESGVEKPRLAVTLHGQVHFFGTPGSVPKDVSRRHCRIQVGEDSRMTVEDLTDNNFIYINGADCKRMVDVPLTDTIELGPSKYRLDMDGIMKALSTRQSFSILAAVFALSFAVIRYRNATVVPLKTRRLEEDFREKYICPNPLCHHFLGATPYKELLKNRNCPYCKSKFTE